MARDIVHDVIGLSELDAVAYLTKSGIKSIRIMERNGQFFYGIENLEPNRVNLYIKNDKVYSAKRG